MSVADDTIPPIVPAGKFFSRAGDKFFLKAVRLEVPSGLLDFESKIALRKRLADLHAAHTNTFLISDENAEPVLDLASRPDSHALVEINIVEDQLLSRSLFDGFRNRVAELRSYTGIIGYLLNCQINPELLRDRGPERIRRRLAAILAAVRELDPHRMIGFKHLPGTSGLILPDEDFVYTVAPPIAADELHSLIVRLHNLAEARPVVLELPHRAPEQSQVIESAFAWGTAGIVAHEMLAGNCRSPQAEAHAFLLRTLKGAELMPFLALNGDCPPKPARTPKVSVVVCAYNAERTMRPCLESLRRLDYPNFEVIIVDDGSRDATAQIAADFPDFRLIRQPNKGLSAARNVGLQAALGEIVAYTDSDCVVDRHWLTFMVRAMLDRGFDACGGPNYAPHEDGSVEGCVAASPGAPSHVLIGDDRAEHLAGCNMVFRKAALEAAGGFDPQFTAAGDDVDICWRLIDSGYSLGYSPSAFVWHFRRNTVKAYYGQQRGYGKAEAMLYFKYPGRFNLLGQVKWKGVIPGLARTIPGGGRRRLQRVRSNDELQGVAEKPLSLIAVAPMTTEWTLLSAVLLLLSWLFGVTIWPAAVALAAGPFWAAYYALKAPLEKCHRGAASRFLIGWLAYSGTIVRTVARYRWRARARHPALFDDNVRQRPTISWLRRSLRLSYWNDSYTTREAILENIRKIFTSLGRPVITDAGWNDFDLVVKPNLWTRIQFRTAEEELGGMQLKTNVAARVRLTGLARAVLATCLPSVAATSIFGGSLALLVFCVVAGGAVITVLGGLAEAAALAYRAVEQSAAELDLVPLGKPVRPAKAPIPAERSENVTEAAQPAGR
ncbi:MAG TPA: glycosyltransferase [Candidatus Binataceae bacterium]|nr:glycosyltransferase [Candidatus Binataceae bacterium]